jgi:hypothetical protein
VSSSARSTGGWNRIHFIVEDIAAEVERLRAAGVTFRNDIVSGPGGRDHGSKQQLGVAA